MKTNIKTGLIHIENHKKNQTEYKVSKSYKEILFQHLFTLFNGINLFLAIIVFFTGSQRNMLFMGTVTLNTIIGLVQEIRSKHKLDRLSILNQTKIQVLRNSKIQWIGLEDIVVDDILILKTGIQIPCDGIVVEGNIECDESILTGESISILKNVKDSVYAGSIVTSGMAKMQVLKVAEDMYVFSIIKDAKRYKRYPSQLRDSLNFIIKWCTYILCPLGTILFVVQYNLFGYTQAVLSTVAAVVGMIPEGLVFLTSVALSIGAQKMARANVLVQELYCLETLARVDTLCLDKTGTLTKGNLKVIKIDSQMDVIPILQDMMYALPDDNATAKAIREYVGDNHFKEAIQVLPFSSERKYSQVIFSDGDYKLGAYEFIVNEIDETVKDKIFSYTSKGYRVLVLYSNEVLAYICIQDELKEDVKEILSYFKEQGVMIKVISGDDTNTVRSICEQANLNGLSFDMRQSKNIPNEISQYSFFGRVAPEQKKEMIASLKQQGHIVAMIGDGVNDIMALKEADCSISMGSGSEACKNIASLILLNNQFSSLPELLKQGRCVINNIQKSASLFLVKNIFSMGLAILALLIIKEYPFKPIQLTLISALSTGIPSFVLTLEPNENRIEGNFLKNVVSKAIPGAFCVILSVLGCFFYRQFIEMTNEQYSTICTILAGCNALFVLKGVCKPFTKIRQLLIGSMSVCFLFSILFFPSFFYLVPLQWKHILYILISVCLMPVVLKILSNICSRIAGF